MILVLRFLWMLANFEARVALSQRAARIGWSAMKMKKSQKN